MSPPVISVPGKVLFSPLTRFVPLTFKPSDKMKTPCRGWLIDFSWCLSFSPMLRAISVALSKSATFSLTLNIVPFSNCIIETAIDCSFTSVPKISLAVEPPIIVASGKLSLIISICWARLAI